MIWPTVSEVVEVYSRKYVRKLKLISQLSIVTCVVNFEIIIVLIRAKLTCNPEGIGIGPMQPEIARPAFISYSKPIIYVNLGKPIPCLSGGPNKKKIGTHRLMVIYLWYSYHFKCCLLIIFVTEPWASIVSLIFSFLILSSLVILRNLYQEYISSLNYRGVLATDRPYLRGTFFLPLSIVHFRKVLLST